MSNPGKIILNIGFSIGIISILYFLSLTCTLPYWLTAIITIVGISSFNIALNRQEPTNRDTTTSWVLPVVYLSGLLILNSTLSTNTEKYGLWDAWSIWNFDAKYLMHSNNWQRLFETTSLAHPDYPFALPATIAFLTKLFGVNHMHQVQFLLHYIITISIPSVILFELFRKSRLIAIISFSLFIFSNTYIRIGVSQLADTLLAFFLLLSIICYTQRDDNKLYVAASAFFIGCCMWTKNEGIVIAIVFILFNLKGLLLNNNYRYTLTGMLLPLSVVIVFKTLYAPANDIIAAQGAKTLSYLTDMSRYRLILNSFADTLYHQFYYFCCFILLYIANCIWKRRIPAHHFNMLLCCLLIYFGVYLVNHNELEWQLFTSMNRLIQQLLPSFVFVIGLQFAESNTNRFQARFFSNR